MTEKIFEKCDMSQISESPAHTLALGTGRAKCRLCGNKIGKGDIELRFFASFTDGGSYNAWTASECHVHASCVKVELKKRLEIYDTWERKLLNNEDLND